MCDVDGMAKGDYPGLNRRLWPREFIHLAFQLEHVAFQE
jgi:hypothetical protein